MTYRMWKSFRALLMHDSNCHASYQHVHDTHTRQTMKHPCYSKAYHHKRQMRGIYPSYLLRLSYPFFSSLSFCPCLFHGKRKKARSSAALLKTHTIPASALVWFLPFQCRRYFGIDEKGLAVQAGSVLWKRRPAESYHFGGRTVCRQGRKSRNSELRG